MKIPKKIKILGRTYEIIFDEKELEKMNGGGEILFRQQKIVLRKKYGYEKRHIDNINVALLHEIIHGILNHLGYDNLGDDNLGDDEDFIRRFSEILYQVIKQIEGD